MGRIVKYSWILLIGSFLFSQDMMSRLKVPIKIKTSIGFGYDNNFLRLSEQEIIEEDVTDYGITSTLDSPIFKPAIKMIYSPAFINGQNTNIVTSISYSYFSQAVQKSYLITNLSLELKFRSYSWLKIGIRDIPKYYLRSYHDWDLSNIDYFDCTFSSQRYFVSYSLPVTWIRKTWIKIYTDYTKEYYNPNFTEFDLDKYMIQFDLNHRTRKKHSVKLSVSHGSAENISYGSYLPSASIDRSYIFDRLWTVFIYKTKSNKIIEQLGISLFLEQRYYELESSTYSFDNWKFYMDGRAKVWINWDILNNVGIKTWYQYRWRNADTQIYSDFEWVEDIKSYTKHAMWLELSYEFVSDILY